jgi:hypothetical protein
MNIDIIQSKEDQFIDEIKSVDEINDINNKWEYYLNNPLKTWDSFDFKYEIKINDKKSFNINIDFTENYIPIIDFNILVDIVGSIYSLDNLCGYYYQYSEHEDNGDFCQYKKLCAKVRLEIMNNFNIEKWEVRENIGTCIYVLIKKDKWWL